MKLRSLIKRAYEIIKAEHEHVVDEFRDDDGNITVENYDEAMALKKKYLDWMKDAERSALDSAPKKKRTNHLRTRRSAASNGKRSALES